MSRIKKVSDPIMIFSRKNCLAVRKLMHGMLKMQLSALVLKPHSPPCGRYLGTHTHYTFHRWTTHTCALRDMRYTCLTWIRQGSTCTQRQRLRSAIYNCSMTLVMWWKNKKTLVYKSDLCTYNNKWIKLWRRSFYSNPLENKSILNKCVSWLNSNM